VIVQDKRRKCRGDAEVLHCVGADEILQR